MLPITAMSDAANRLRSLLIKEIDDLETISQISIGHPKSTIEGLGGELKNLNLFFYNVSYDGYPADGSSDNPFYVRLYCLITAVCKSSVLNSSPSPGENDLRLIGEVMRVMHEQPIVSVDGGGSNVIAQLQIVPHSLSLDNLNHIWSTQGEEPYRLSVAYEISLLPVPLVSPIERSPRVGETGTDVSGSSDPESLPDEGFGIKTSAPDVPKYTVDITKPDWIPHICFVDEANRKLAYSMVIPKSQLPSPRSLTLKAHIAGKPSSKVRFVWESWKLQRGWKFSRKTKYKTLLSSEIDPDSFFDPLIRERMFETKLPIRSEGQATLYAERIWEHPNGSRIKLRSNPLLVTVYEAGA